jgi:hypothetical protein
VVKNPSASGLTRPGKQSVNGGNCQVPMRRYGFDKVSRIGGIFSSLVSAVLLN